MVKGKTKEKKGNKGETLKKVRKRWRKMGEKK